MEDEYDEETEYLDQFRLAPSEPEPSLHQAVRNHELTRIQEILSGDIRINTIYFPNTALGVAATIGDSEAVSLLLNYGANPDLCDEVPPLMAAVLGGHEAIVRRLLEAGADPNNAESEFQQTALLWAVRQGLINIAAILLLYGADPTLPDRFGKSALYLAQERGDEVIITILQRAMSPDSID